MSCDLCNCIGWKVIERGGTSGVDRCECRNCAPASEGQAPLDVQNGAALTKILFDQFSFAGPSPGRAVGDCDGSDGNVWHVGSARIPCSDLAQFGRCDAEDLAITEPR